MKRATAQRIAVAVLLFLAVVLFRQLELGRYFSLEYVKESQAGFRELYQGRSLTILGAYFVLYVLVTALSLPGAAVLTLAGGAIFGFWATLITVSFASSLGATLACLVARFVLRDWVQRGFGDKLTVVNQGMEREGAFYLFTLRLVPVFPFFVINLVMGLTPMRLSTFYWVSQIGMLPGTAVFVNAGRELGRIESVSGVLSPGLILSFALLGLFPLLVKKGLGWYRNRRERTAEP